MVCAAASSDDENVSHTDQPFYFCGRFGIAAGIFSTGSSACTRSVFCCWHHHQKSEVLCLSRNPRQCTLQVSGNTLQQVEKFKYLRVVFTSDEKRNKEFRHPVVTKRELSNTGKLLVFKSVFVPILTTGHESWVMTGRILSQVQATEMGFLRIVNDVTLRDKVCSWEIYEAPNVKSLPQIERSQLRWFGHVTKMSQEKSVRQVLLATHTGKWPRGRPRTRGRDYISDLAWPRPDVDPAELSEIAVNREVS